MIGKCNYENCDCVEFTGLEFFLPIIITNADLFEKENPDHSKRGTLHWENEFESWRRKRERI
jgi:hypothetical protein